MTRIEREKQIVTKMIALYCRHRHGQQQMSEKYRSLADYACQRLEHCRYGEKLKHWLQSLSYRTGVIVLLCCIPFYILSFAQMLLPISAAAKGVLWTVLFGLAKTCQYGGLTILGVEGYKRLKDKFRKNKD